jgi:hypothetical protein
MLLVRFATDFDVAAAKWWRFQIFGDCCGCCGTYGI